VLTEGLLMYLDDALVEGLARDLARPAVAWWAFDLLSPATRDLVMRAMSVDLANAPMRFAPPNGVAFFEERGWKARDIVSLLDEAARLGRLPWLLWFLAHLPASRPDPRRLARSYWSAAVRLER